MSSSPLSPHQIAAYMRDGVLVVDGLLTRDEVVEARRGLATTLMEGYGVDVRDLKGTGRGLSRASSTDGAGKRRRFCYAESYLVIIVVVAINASSRPVRRCPCTCAHR